MSPARRVMDREVAPMIRHRRAQGKSREQLRNGLCVAFARREMNGKLAVEVEAQLEVDVPWYNDGTIVLE